MSTCPITNEVTLSLIEKVPAKFVHCNIKHLINAFRSVSISTYKKILSSHWSLWSNPSLPNSTFVPLFSDSEKQLSIIHLTVSLLLLSFSVCPTYTCIFFPKYISGASTFKRSTDLILMWNLKRNSFLWIKKEQCTRCPIQVCKFRTLEDLLQHNNRPPHPPHQKKKASICRICGICLEILQVNF